MLHEWLSVMVNFFVITLEFMGLIVIVYTAVKSFIGWMKKDPATRLRLAEGLAMALSFKLGGEILRTVVVRDMSEIMQVGAIIILRAALTFLIHWEIKNEEQEIEQHAGKNHTHIE
ncbi:MAG: DUF1622 domain-containing protein [Oscillospiraceae bacterium]|nr:DUF1622 domain-containing protein [Oscillospiraceae bacterium]